MKASELTINEKARLVNGISFFGMYDPVNKENGRIQLLDGGTGINFEQLFGDIYETSPEISERFSRSSLHAVIENYYAPEKYENDEAELAEEITKKLIEKCGGKEYSPGCFPSADLTVSPENADVTVFICTLEGAEGNDRKNMYLKREDISELYRLGAVKKEALPDEFKDIVSAEPEKKCSDIILVLNICGPADLSLIDRNTVKAVLCTFITGMQGPAALADILCGKINPSGKLPVTFPEKYEQCPSFINFPGDGYEVCYGEGIFNGYKYYDTKKIRPLYRFGYGLSYTEFSIGKINDLIIERDIISFCINAENTGKYSGSEVIQIYISDPFSTLRKPEKELKAFRKLFLKPGEIKTIRFEIPLCSLSSFDSDLNKFTVEEGYYNITAAVSSDPSDAADTKQIYIDTESPYSFGINSSVKTIYENHELYSIFRKFWNNAGYDPTIPNANYQYTPSRKISDIIRDADIKAELSSDTVTKLNSELKRIKKN